MPDLARPVAEVMPSIPEVIRSPEVTEHNEKPAVNVEKSIEVSQEAQEATPTQEVPAVSTSTALVAPIVKSPVRRNIEKVLEEDLKFLYLELPPERRVIFRQQGDLTASRIEYLMGQATMKISYLVYLIRRWLTLLPGVNYYFIEQESKIKAEKILFLNAKE